ncbi:UNVERIFIED_CONTAM: hypothetical protein RMT77_006287 [Armadillidium vulgare]
MSSNTKPKVSKKKEKDIPPPLPTSPPPSLNSKENVNPEGETRKVECPFSSEQHEGKEFAHVTLSLPPQEVYRLLFKDETFLTSIYNDKNYVDLVFTPWSKSEENGDTTRTITYTANLPSKALGPSISHVTEVQTISGKSQANDLYVVNCIVQNSGIPYGDSFKIHIHYCIIKERSQNSLPQTKFAYYCIVKFKKAPLFFIKTMIEKNTYDGLQSVCEELVNALSNEADKSDGIVTRPKRKRGNSTIDGSEVNKKKKETEETSKGFSKRVKTCSSLLVFLILISIASLNAYLYMQLKQIEMSTYHKNNILLEKFTTAISRDPPNSESELEESIEKLMSERRILQKNFDEWKEKLDRVFLTLNSSITELTDVIEQLPAYMVDFMSLTAELENKNIQKSIKEKHDTKKRVTFQPTLE